MKTSLTRIANRLTQANIYGFASKELKFGNQARNKMLEGCDLLANAVQVTLGPNGRNVLIDSGYGSVKNTYDDVVKKDISITLAYVKDWFKRNIERTTQLKCFNSYVFVQKAK